MGRAGQRNLEGEQAWSPPEGGSHKQGEELVRCRKVGKQSPPARQSDWSGLNPGAQLGEPSVPQPFNCKIRVINALSTGGVCKVRPEEPEDC